MRTFDLKNKTILDLGRECLPSLLPKMPPNHEKYLCLLVIQGHTKFLQGVHDNRELPNTSPKFFKAPKDPRGMSVVRVLSQILLAEVAAQLLIKSGTE